MNKIYLYNHFHNGDIFLNQPIVRNLCKNNPQYAFTYFSMFNSFILKDIENLTVDLKNLFVSLPFNNCENKFIKLEDGTIAINLWCGVYIHDTITYPKHNI